MAVSVVDGAQVGIITTVAIFSSWYNSIIVERRVYSRSSSRFRGVNLRSAINLFFELKQANNLSHV